jgi:hypothetical protein
MSAPETWEDITAHMRQMAITAREFRLPPEDCDDLTQYAAALDTLRAERDALAARVVWLRDALSNIAVVGYSDDPAVNAAIARQTVDQARAALSTDAQEG